MSADPATPAGPAADPREHQGTVAVPTQFDTGPSELASWTLILGGFAFTGALLAVLLSTTGYLHLMAAGGMLTAFGLGLWGESL